MSKEKEHWFTTVYLQQQQQQQQHQQQNNQQPQQQDQTRSMPDRPHDDTPPEEACELSEVVLEPDDNDILCGRGGLTNTHPGNVWYRSLVRTNRPLYKNERKHGKIQIAKAIVNHVLSQNPPSRFLEQHCKLQRQHSTKKGRPYWVTISRKRAIDKTSQALRERNRCLEDGEEDNDAYRVEEFHQRRPAASLVLTPPPDFETTVVRRSAQRNFSISVETDEDVSNRRLAEAAEASVPQRIQARDVSAATAWDTARRHTTTNSSSTTTENPIAASLLNLKRKLPAAAPFVPVAPAPSGPDMLHQHSATRTDGPEIENMVERISSRFRQNTANKRPRTMLQEYEQQQHQQRQQAAQYCRNAALQYGSANMRATAHQQYQYTGAQSAQQRQQQVATHSSLPTATSHHLAAPTATAALVTSAPMAPLRSSLPRGQIGAALAAVRQASPIQSQPALPLYFPGQQQKQMTPPASILRTKVSPAEEVALSTLTSFLGRQEKKPPVATAASRTTVNDDDDQFADSQDDQFADPEEEEEAVLLTTKPPATAAPIPLFEPSFSEEKETAENDKMKLKAAVAPVVTKSAESMPEQKESTDYFDDDPSAVEIMIPRIAPQKFFALKQKAKKNSDETFARTTKFHDPASTHVNAGALCRVCKAVRFNRTSVPTTHFMETHPELSWPIAKIKSRRAITVVLEHCLQAHPHWPLWNTLSHAPFSPSSSFLGQENNADVAAAATSICDGLPPANKLRAIHVFHRALATACGAAPHRLCDTYDSSEEMGIKIARRLGLAEGFVKWGQWETNNRKALEVLASSMIRDYGSTLLGAIKENWGEIEEKSHQERLDLFNNVFVIPYCIDTLREKGMCQSTQKVCSCV